MTDAIRTRSIDAAARALAASVEDGSGRSPADAGSAIPPGPVPVAVAVLAAATDAAPGEALGYELRRDPGSGPRLDPNPAPNLVATVFLAGVEEPGAVAAHEVRAVVASTIGLRGWDGVEVVDVAVESPPGGPIPGLATDRRPTAVVRVAVSIPG